MVLRLAHEVTCSWRTECAGLHRITHSTYRRDHVWMIEIIIDKVKRGLLDPFGGLMPAVCERYRILLCTISRDCVFDTPLGYLRSDN